MKYILYLLIASFALNASDNHHIDVLLRRLGIEYKNFQRRFKIEQNIKRKLLLAAENRETLKKESKYRRSRSCKR